VDVIARQLGRSGLILRYRRSDGLRGPEGVFLACTFWLVECLAHQGRLDEARKVFRRACACANDVGLFSEQYATQRREMLGNFPQGLTHLAHVAAALALAGSTAQSKVAEPDNPVLRHETHRQPAKHRQDGDQLRPAHSSSRQARRRDARRKSTSSRKLTRAK
jgi:hypothetical protein